MLQLHFFQFDKAISNCLGCMRQWKYRLWSCFWWLVKIFSLTLKKHSSFQLVMVVLRKLWITLLCHWKKCSVRDSWLYSAFTWLMLSFKHSWYKGLVLHISGFCFVHYLFIFLMCVVPEYPILLSPIPCWQKTAHLYFLLNNYWFFFVL